jgi:mannosyltransferase
VGVDVTEHRRTDAESRVAMVPAAHRIRGGDGAVLGGLLLITGLAAALRFYRIGANALWVDEAYSRWVAGHSVGAIWQLLGRIDDQPPLHYVLMHLALPLGDREATLRFVSALCGTLTVPLAYWFGSIVRDRSLGLLTALLVAVSPFDVQYSQDARMYPLLALAAAVTMVGLAWLLRWSAASTPGRAHAGGEQETVQPRIRAGSGGAWAAYVLGGAAALWTHYTAIFLIAAANVTVAWLLLSGTLRKTFLRPWILAQFAVGCLCVPLCLLLFSQLRNGAVTKTTWVPAPTLRSVAGVVRQLMAGTAFLDHPAPVVYVVGIGLVALGLWGWRRERRWIILTAALVIVPIGGVLAISAWHSILINRVFIWTTIPLCLAIAAGLLQLPRPVGIVVGLVLLAIDCSGLSTAYWRIPEAEPWDQAAGYVAGRLQLQDTILLDSSYTRYAFEYYFSRARPHPVPGVRIETVDAEDALATRVLSARDAAVVQTKVGAGRRIWLVAYERPPGQSSPAVRAALGAHERLLVERIFTGAQAAIPVSLYGGSAVPGPRK